MQDTGAHPKAYRDDEIDLLELVRGLWAQKAIILCVTALVTAGAIAYALLATPVYEAKATVLPPLLSNIAAYNAGRTESSLYTSDEDASGQAARLKPFSTEDVYKLFTRNLNSQSLRRSFFKKVYIPSLPESQRSAPEDQLWSGFNSLLSIKSPDKQRPELIEVSIQHSDPQKAADWTNQLIANAAAAAERNMQLNVMSEINTRILSIERRIASLRSTAQQRREDRVAILSEALSVANAVGMVNPQVTAGHTSSNQELSEFIDGSLTYMRGAKAIEAEMGVLEARQSDDPFIPELRGLQEQLSFLNTIHIQADDVSVFTLDNAAATPQTPIKPKKSLIAALGLVLGGMLGVFIALVRMLVRRQSSQA